MNDATLVSLTVLALLGAVMMLLPALTPRRYYFGLTVAPEFRDSHEGRAIQREFHYVVAVALVLTAVAVVALPAWSMPAAMFVIPIVGSVAFFHARSRVRRFSTETLPIREAEISRVPDRLPLWTLLALPPLAVPVALAAYLRAHWDEIPARFPVHWGWDGQPNRWVPRSPHGVYGPLAFGALAMAALMMTGLAVFYGARRSPWRIVMLKIMLAVLYFVAFVFGMVSLLPVRHFPAAIWAVPILLFVVVILAYSAKLSSDPDLPADDTPDSRWWLSSIYYNPADPALFVQKRIGIGYTVNLGNRLSWLCMGVMLALIPAAIFLLR